MSTKTSTIINEIEKVIVGKRRVVERVLMALLSEGHVLLDDVPGVGKPPWPWPAPGSWVWTITGFSSLLMWCLPTLWAFPFTERKRDVLIINQVW